MIAKAMTKSELASSYYNGMTPATLLAWIKKEKVFATDEELEDYKRRKIIPATMVRKIYDSKIGEPDI